MTGPHPAVALVRQAVRQALDDVPPGALVLVACSGGADSLALAHGAAFVAGRAGWRAGAVVVDHGWQPGSAEVAAAAAAAVSSLGLDPVLVERVDTTGPGGPEASARAARYAALERVAFEQRAVAVLTGHTLDDVAESVLLGLARGSGARSLSGIPARRGLLRRPLLHVRREQTVAACAALGLDPWQDPANTDPAFTRVRVRQALATLEAAVGPGLVDALSRTADLLREDADALDAQGAQLVAAARLPARRRRGPERMSLDVAVLAGAPDAVRRRAILAACRAVGAPAGALGRRHVLAVDALVTRWKGQGVVHLPGRVEAGRDCGTLWLAGPAGR